MQYKYLGLAPYSLTRIPFEVASIFKAALLLYDYDEICNLGANWWKLQLVKTCWCVLYRELYCTQESLITRTENLKASEDLENYGIDNKD